MKFYRNHPPSVHDMALFFQQLATLIAANIPILQCCQLLLQSQSNRILQIVISTLKSEIEAGHGLSFGLKKFPLLFNQFICCLVQMGESTGTLQQILQEIAKLLTKSAYVRDQIKHALFYPIIVLIISLIVCLLMLIFIVPRFAEFFQGLHAQLPWVTLMIMNLSDIIREKYLWGLGTIVGLILSFKFYKPSSLSQQRFKQIIYKLPGIHTLIDRFFILHFVKNLAIIYSSGISITEGLKLMSEISAYSEHQRVILKVRDRINSGKQLNISMRFCTIFSPVVIDMVRIGEETGTLHTMLNTVEHLYQTALDRTFAKMNLLLEPLIMVILGVLIGGLVIAMYLPIFRIGMII